MYLNVRKPPLRSKFYWNPLKFFFPRPDHSSSSSPSTTSRVASRSPSPPPVVRPRSASTTRPIHTIPPATNPRGELIFSSRVDKNFRESYERYRSAFERRREGKEYIERHKTWWGKLMFWERPPASLGTVTTPGTTGGTNTPLPSRTPSTSTPRGRGSRSGTPPTGADGIVMKQRDRSGSPSVRRSPRLTEKAGRRERDSGSETDMRTAVLERSVNQAAAQSQR
jgi:hypothetical protein